MLGTCPQVSLRFDPLATYSQACLNNPNLVPPSHWSYNQSMSASCKALDSSNRPLALSSTNAKVPHQLSSMYHVHIVPMPHGCTNLIPLPYMLRPSCLWSPLVLHNPHVTSHVLACFTLPRATPCLTHLMLGSSSVSLGIPQPMLCAIQAMLHSMTCFPSLWLWTHGYLIHGPWHYTHGDNDVKACPRLASCMSWPISHVPWSCPYIDATPCHEKPYDIPLLS